MNIELLYFDGCPNHEPLLAHLRELLVREGIEEPIQLRRVESLEDAERERFLGSPTLRIGGHDVEPGAEAREDFGFKCRLYRTGSGTGGMPADGLILSALIFPGREWAASRTSRLTPAVRALHVGILEALAAGQKPDPVEDEHARAALQRADLVHFDPDKGAVLLAYPFSARPTAHRVKIGPGPEVFSMCAIDALGIPFMLDQPAHIRSEDPSTGEPIEVTIDPHGERTWSPEQAAVVVAGDPTGGASAECMCPQTNFAASPQSARAQLEQLSDRPGAVLSMPDAIETGRAGFGALLAPTPGYSPTPPADA